MRAKDFLTELWTQPYELTQKKWGGRIEYLFTTKDGRAGSINIDDAQIGEHSAVVIHFYIDGHHGTSGRGDAIRIFSTVVSAGRDWFSKHSPDFVIFESDDSKKLQVYARMAATLLKNYVQFPNWSSSEYSDAIWDQSGEGLEEDMLVYVKRNLQLSEGVDIGQEWMSDTELDQYVPDHLQQEWRELLGYDEDGNPSALWTNLTGVYEPDVNDPQHRALMVKVANKWFAAKRIPNVKFFDVKDADDELEWLVQIGQPVNEFVDDRGGDGGGEGRKFLPWEEFIADLQAILENHFSVKQSIIKDNIKARFIPHDPMEFGPTMLYSYYERRAGRKKGAISNHGAIQVGKYHSGGLDGKQQDKLLSVFDILKGHPFERKFDLTGENVQKIADIIIGNTQGALEFQPQGVAEGSDNSDNPFELKKKHPMNHGMKKFMIRQIAKHTDYGTSELSLASDEELTQLFNEVVPNAQELTQRFAGFLSEKIAEEKESRLYRQHQKIRKEKGLPDPSHYKKMAQQKQKEIDALNAEIAADKAKLKEDYLEEN